MYNIILVIHVILAIALVGIILIQRPDGNSLAGLSGGDNMGFLSGRAAGNLLTKTTAILAVFFIVTSISLAVIAKGNVKQTALVAESASQRETPAQNIPDTPKPKAPVSSQ